MGTPAPVRDNFSLAIDEIIPLCESYGIIELLETKQSKQANTKAWRLALDLEVILKYDGETSDDKLSKFWQEVNEK